MEQFPDSFGKISVIFEMLLERHDIRVCIAHMRLQVIHFRGIGPFSGEKARSGRSADRLLTVRPFEQNTALRKSIDIRGLDHRMTIASQFRTEIIDSDEEDILPPRVDGTEFGRIHSEHLLQRGETDHPADTDDGTA